MYLFGCYNTFFEGKTSCRFQRKLVSCDKHLFVERVPFGLKCTFCGKGYISKGSKSSLFCTGRRNAHRRFPSPFKSLSNRATHARTRLGLSRGIFRSGPVWDVAFGPTGYYFATASADRTACLWSTDSAQPLRIFAGHLDGVLCVA